MFVRVHLKSGNIRVYRVLDRHCISVTSNALSIEDYDHISVFILRSLISYIQTSRDYLSWDIDSSILK